MAKPTKVNASSLYVEYGDNVSGTGFLDAEGDPLGSSLWNLNKFHSSADARSPLKLLQTPIAGVTTPHVYHGALFSTSSWLVEELYLLSLNFLHIGAPKTWYAVPAQHADDFENAVQDKVRTLLPQSLLAPVTRSPPAAFVAQWRDIRFTSHTCLLYTSPSPRD